MKSIVLLTVPILAFTRIINLTEILEGVLPLKPPVNHQRRQSDS